MAFLVILLRNTYYLHGKASPTLNNMYYCISVHTAETYVVLLAVVIE